MALSNEEMTILEELFSRELDIMDLKQCRDALYWAEGYIYRLLEEIARIHLASGNAAEVAETYKEILRLERVSGLHLEFILPNWKGAEVETL